MAATGKKINELTAISTVSDQTVLPAVYVDGSTTATTATKISISQISTKVQNDMSSALSAKQDKLTAGDNITISEQNVISAAVDVLPSQSGQSGKFLTTDGTAASWATVSAGANTSLSNITHDGENQIMNLLMPTLNAKEKLSSPSANVLYTAPAAGYVMAGAAKLNTNTGCYLATFTSEATSINDSDQIIFNVQVSSGTQSGTYMTMVLPIAKGDKFGVYSDGTLQTLIIRFVYMNGSYTDATPIGGN